MTYTRTIFILLFFSGGGVIGCSVLYHLCKRGINAILLEKHKLTSGTTWHSGAIVWSLRANDVDNIMLQKTRTLLSNLEAGTGVNSGWINNGGIFIARTPVSTKKHVLTTNIQKTLLI